MKNFIFVMLLVACHREIKQQVQLDTVEHKDKAIAVELDKTETREQAESDIDTKTSHQDNAIVISEPDGTVQIARVEAKKPLSLPKGSKVIGVVPLASTTVEQNKRMGPITDTKADNSKKNLNSSDDKNSKLKTKLEDTRDTGPGFKFYLSCLAGLLGLLGAGYFYLKMVKKVSWL